MANYTIIKDLIVYSDLIIGDITLDEILNYLLLQIQNQRKFEEIVYSNLKQTDLTDRDIATIFSLSSTNIIETYIKLIKNEL